MNQNPFSAEFDKIGYGRIEILTKPGSDKFSGHITSLGNDSAWNTANPLVQQQPSYYLYFIQADVNGPLTKNASYFFSLFRFDRQNQSIIDAVNPEDTSTTFNEALPNPSSLLFANPRVDFQLGKSNTLSVRDSYFRSVATANGPGQLNLPEQAFNLNNQENAIQVSDTVVVNPRVINETHFQWRRVRNSQAASYFTPTVTVQGAFTTGGSNSGVAQDHQDIFELQNYSTATAGATPYDLGPSACLSRCQLFHSRIERELSIHFGRPVPGENACAISGHRDPESAGASAFVRRSSLLSGRLAYET